MKFIKWLDKGTESGIGLIGFEVGFVMVVNKVMMVIFT